MPHGFLFWVEAVTNPMLSLVTWDHRRHAGHGGASSTEARTHIVWMQNARVPCRCDVVYAMLADPDAARAVATGPDGVATGMEASPGKAYVDVSTVDEKTSQDIAAAVKKSGGRFLEVSTMLVRLPWGRNAASLACTLEIPATALLLND